jgi:hypothetical protein
MARIDRAVTHIHWALAAGGVPGRDLGDTPKTVTSIAKTAIYTERNSYRHGKCQGHQALSAIS